MMKACHLLKKETVFSPSPLPLFIKLEPSKFLGHRTSHLPACKSHMHLVLLNHLSITLPLLILFCTET